MGSAARRDSPDEAAVEVQAPPAAALPAAASLGPDAASPLAAQVLRLQVAAGNRAVARWVAAHPATGTSSARLARETDTATAPARAPTKDPGVPGLGPKAKQVQYLVDAGFRDLALQYIVRYKISEGAFDPSLLVDATMSYDENLSDDGRCSMQAWDYLNNRAEKTKVRIGPTAFSTVPYLYSVVMHEYRHVLQRQSLANQDREKNLRSQGFKSGNEVEAYAWELDHTDETGVKQEPGSVASIWKQLNDEYQLLEDTERKRMLSTAKAAFAKAQALVKGTGVTLEPFKP